jgi:hypothetical protein
MIPSDAAFASMGVVSASVSKKNENALNNFRDKVIA